MDYPQNLSESDRRWYDLIQQCRTSGKSDRQWLSENNISSPTFYYHIKQLRKKACEIPASIYSSISEKQDVVPIVIHDLPLEKSNTVISESVSQPDDTALHLIIQGVTVEITNQATQSAIQNCWDSHTPCFESLTGRMDLLTVDESVRLNANMMVQFDGMLDDLLNNQ